MTESRHMVFVVDDDSAVRTALTRLLQTAGWTVETFETAQQFLDYPRADLPSCLLLDVRMPGLSGIELQERLAEWDDLPIVFVTGHGDIPMAVNAMKSGALDFLTKPVNKEQLLATVQRAIDTHRQTKQQSAEVAEFRRRVESLTPREHEVMGLVITGMLNKQVARRLGITEATVKLHRGHVMEKIGVKSLAELVQLNERAAMSQGQSR